MFHFKKKASGFTLIELLIVLTIIALASSVVLPDMWNQLDRSKMNSEVKQVEKLLAYTQNKAYFSNQSFEIQLDKQQITIKDHDDKVMKQLSLSYLNFEARSINISLRNPYRVLDLKVSIENKEVVLKL